MKRRIPAFIALLMFSGAVVASGDWNPGDPFKMHYPQLPDPTGWDVSFAGKTLADDFQCTQSGPITDIHFWVSWKNDVQDWAAIYNVHLSIHDDIPVGPGVPYSRPADPALWERDLGDAEMGRWIARLYGEPSVQGWYEPMSQPPEVLPDNHEQTWQINVPNIEAPFIQEMGKIYWLDIRIEIESLIGAAVGWKTSMSTHFNDDAVWGDAPEMWEELRDPLTGVSLDLAFVVVPEPTTGALLLLFGAAALARRRWKRNG